MAAVSDCFGNCTELDCIQEWSTEDLWAPWQVFNNYFEYQPWLFSLLGSAMVGLSGVFPLLVIPIDEAADLKHGDGAKTLKILLSFAVGGLLGDVFLHLLPEAWANHAKAYTAKSSRVNDTSMECGMWVLCGFLIFVIAEKLFNIENIPKDDDNDRNSKPIITKDIHKKLNEQFNENNNCSLLDELHDCTKIAKNVFSNGEVMKITGLRKDQQLNGLKKLSNGINYKKCNGCANGFLENNTIKHKLNGFCNMRELSNKRDGRICMKQLSDNKMIDKPKYVSGYLNLVANSVDNFTHGLAIGGSFLVSFRLGSLTTFAILVHEIPHEIGDFAILLRSGFNRWNAAKAQLITATGGMFGAFVAVIFSGDAVESKTNWILPFTAGGFLHIGMVTILPELLKETNPWESLKQIGALLTGIIVMAFLTIICD